MASSSVFDVAEPILNDERAKKPLASHFVGVGLTFVNSIIVAIQAVIYKLLMQRHNMIIVVCLRSTLMLFCATAMLLARRVNPIDAPLLARHWRQLLPRCLLSTMAFPLYLVSLQLIPMGEATALTRVTPIFVALLSKLFLGRRYSLWHGLAAFLVIFGCVLIARPPIVFGDEVDDVPLWQRVAGTLAALTVALCGATVYILLRLLSEMDAGIVVFYVGLLSAPMSGVGALLAGELGMPDELETLGLVTLTGLLSYINQASVTVACKHEEPNVIALLRTTGIVFSFLLQIYFFDRVPLWTSAIGCALIAIAVLLVGLKKLLAISAKAL